MANPYGNPGNKGGDPRKARQVKAAKRRQALGDLQVLKEKMWTVLQHVEAVLTRASAAKDDDLILRACHCYSQVGAQVVKITEAGDLEARVAALEARVMQERAA